MPRFLCDEMLGRLCRYLRTAGYDALLASDGRSDRELLAQCHAEERFFLTQDQLIREHKAAHNVAVLLPQGDLDQLATAVGAHFRLDWLAHAFTRCIEDNTPLVVADAAALARVPADALKPGEPFRQCPTCRRVYWRGSHYRRMRTRLATWEATEKETSTPPIVAV